MTTLFTAKETKCLWLITVGVGVCSRLLAIELERPNSEAEKSFCCG